MNEATNEKWRVYIKIVASYILLEGVHKRCTTSISIYQILETNWQCYTYVAICGSGIPLIWSVKVLHMCYINPQNS